MNEEEVHRVNLELDITAFDEALIGLSGIRKETIIAEWKSSSKGSGKTDIQVSNYNVVGELKEISHLLRSQSSQLDVTSDELSRMDKALDYAMAFISQIKSMGNLSTALTPRAFKKEGLTKEIRFKVPLNYFPYEENMSSGKLKEFLEDHLGEVDEIISKIEAKNVEPQNTFQSPSVMILGQWYFENGQDLYVEVTTADGDVVVWLKDEDLNIFPENRSFFLRKRGVDVSEEKTEGETA